MFCKLSDRDCRSYLPELSRRMYHFRGYQVNPCIGQKCYENYDPLHNSAFDVLMIAISPTHLSRRIFCTTKTLNSLCCQALYDIHITCVYIYIYIYIHIYIYIYMYIYIYIYYAIDIYSINVIWITYVLCCQEFVAPKLASRALSARRPFVLLLYYYYIYIYTYVCITIYYYNIILLYITTSILLLYSTTILLLYITMYYYNIILYIATSVDREFTKGGLVQGVWRFKRFPCAIVMH